MELARALVALSLALGPSGCLEQSTRPGMRPQIIDPIDASDGSVPFDGSLGDAGPGRGEPDAMQGEACTEVPCAEGHCNPQSGTCEQCITSAHCPAEMPVCADDHCTPCGTNAQCSRFGATPICGEDGECVQCETNADCKDEGAPHCEASVCAPCNSDEDCEGKACDTLTGACVECTSTNASACGGSVCDSRARTCAWGVLPQSAELCETCLSDAQCGKTTPALCLPTSFEQADTGYSCLPTLLDGESCISDHRPYVSPAIDEVAQPLASIDGSTDSACQLAVTTCAAFRGFGREPCAGPEDDAACGVINLDDGACRKVPNQDAYRCTVPCRNSNDCSNVGSSCPTGGGYCSL